MITVKSKKSQALARFIEATDNFHSQSREVTSLATSSYRSDYISLRGKFQSDNSELFNSHRASLSEVANSNQCAADRDNLVDSLTKKYDERSSDLSLKYRGDVAYLQESFRAATIAVKEKLDSDVASYLEVYNEEFFGL